MQNKLDNGKLLFTEYVNHEGFAIREMHHADNRNLRFQVGYNVDRPMQMPVYGSDAQGVTHYLPTGTTRVFHIHGHGPTLEMATQRACAKLLRQDAANAARKEKPNFRSR